MTLPLFQSRPHCVNCGLFEDCQNPGVPSRLLSPWSPDKPLIVWLGQNPGFNEDKQNSPFVGDSGTLLIDGYLKPYNLTTRAVNLLTNSARCHTVGNTPPNLTTLAACSPYFLQDLVDAVYSRLYIVCLGSIATTFLFRYILGHKSMPQKEAFKKNLHTFALPDSLELKVLTKKGKTKATLERGNPSPRTFTHVSTYHPAAVLRDPNLALSIENHLRLLSDHLDDVAASPSKPDVRPPFPPPHLPAA